MTSGLLDWRWLPIVILVALVVVPAAPVQLSYVVSDSMEPTLETGDGFLLVPAGNIETGTVVTFRPSGADRPVTHRVVAVTSEGLVTKGDANEVTDQAAGYEHVQRQQVVGKTLTVGGTVVTIPWLGTVSRTINEHLLEVGAGLLLVLFGNELRRSDRSPTRRPVRSSDVVRPLLVGLLVFGVAMVFVATSTHTVTYVASEVQTDHPKQLTVGKPATKPLLLEGNAPPFTHRIIAVDGMEVVDVEENAGETGTGLRLHVAIPPPETYGVFRKTVRVYHYPATVPESLLRPLHAIHPLFAALVSVGVALGPLVVITMLTIDGRRPLRPPRSRRLQEVFR